MARARQRYPSQSSPETATPSQVADRRIGMGRSGVGVGVDVHGGPVIDPTANVLALVEAANRRQDDLREMNNARIDAELRNQEQMADLRAQHQREIDTLESKRLDAVRTVDQLAAKTEADRQASAVTTLATAASTTAETLRSAVNTSAQNLAAQSTNSATTLATQFAATVGQLTERIAALEKSSYTGQGKQAVADPAIERMSTMVEALVRAQAAGAGKSEGVSASWVILLGAVSLVGGLFGIAGMLFAVLKS